MNTTGNINKLFFPTVAGRGLLSNWRGANRTVAKRRLASCMTHGPQEERSKTITPLTPIMATKECYRSCSGSHSFKNTRGDEWKNPKGYVRVLHNRAIREGHGGAKQIS